MTRHEGGWLTVPKEPNGNQPSGSQASRERDVEARPTFFFFASFSASLRSLSSLVLAPTDSGATILADEYTGESSVSSGWIHASCNRRLLPRS